jgi:hypothetical protein
VGLALVAFLLALGRYGPAALLLVRTPLLDKCRFPARHVVLVHLGLAGLAALAVDDLLRCPAADRRRAVGRTAWLALVPLASAACCAGVLLLARQGAELPRLSSPARLWFNVPLLAAAAAVVGLAAHRPRLGLLGILGFTIADQAVDVNYMLIWRRAMVRPLSTAWRELPDLPSTPEGFRMVSFLAPPVTLAGVSLTGGNASLVPARALDYERPEVRRLAGVAWAWNFNDRLWRRTADPLPRARLVTRAIKSAEPPRLAEIDLETTAIVPEPLPGLRGPPGRVMIRRDRPGDCLLDVEAPNRQLLVWNESYHPGWAVTIDGRPEAVVRANFDFQGCVVPPGRHTVTFRYRPRSFLIGALGSGAGLALLIGMLTIGGRQSPGARRESNDSRLL